MRMSASASNLLRYFIFANVYDENPLWQRYVVGKGISIRIGFLAKDRFSF